MRNLDRPLEDGVDGLNREVISSRLGLSATVAAQIERYGRLARRGGTVSADEVASVFRLVARRADADLVLADAGRRAARHAARSGRRPFRSIRRAAPAVFRWLGVRDASRLSRRVFGTHLEVGHQGAEARLESPIPVAPESGTGACAFYGAALHELLRFLTGFEGSLIHEHCRGRGHDTCRWRAVAVEDNA